MGQSCTVEQDFDSRTWKYETDIGTHPYRNAMLSNPIEKEDIIGLSKEEVIAIFGESELNNDELDMVLCYEIETKFGWDIDLIYEKSFVLSLDENDQVIGYKIHEWGDD